MKFFVAPLAVLLGLMVHAAPAETISWPKVPPAVQKTIHERLPAAKIGDIDRDEENSEVTYVFEITIAGQTREYTLNESGRIVKVQVFLRELPGAVQKGIQSVIGQGTTASIEKVLEDESSYYEVEWKKKDGAEHVFSVWENGALKSEQIALAQCPTPVQATIQHEAGDAKVTEIAKAFDSDAVHYVVTIVRDGKDRELTVSESGQIQRMEVTIEEMAPAVKDAIGVIIGQGRIASLDKVFEDGAIQYDVDWKTKDGAAHSFSMLESGKLKSVQVTLAETPPAVRTAIVQGIGSGKLKDIAKSYGDEGVTYDVTVIRGGKDRDLSIAESGQVVRIELTLMETPPPVQRGIQSFIGQGRIVSIDKAVEDGQTQFSVDWKTKEGATHTFTLLENGKMKSVGVALEETPPGVNAAIVQEAGSGKLKEIVKSFEDNAVAYDVTVNRDGTDRDFTVAESGKLERRQLLLGEISAAPQSSIKRITTGGTILRIDQVFEKGGFRLEVESLVGGKRYDFSVGQNGLFLGVNQ